MENATHFIEICKDELSGRYIQYPVNDISKLKANLSYSQKLYRFHTVVVWQIKIKQPIIISGEEVNGQTILIAESC